MRRSVPIILTITAMLTWSVILAGCKNQSQPAEPSSASAQQMQQPTPPTATPVAASNAPRSTESAPAKTPAETPAQAPVPVQSVPPTPVASIAGLPDVDPRETRGSKSAPIIMETFSDFQCPACKQLYVTTNRQLTDNYVSTGKVFQIHRDFPLAGHAYSRVAARYSRAAASMGKFDQVELVLFQNQEKWEQTGDVDGTLVSSFTPAEMTKIRALTKTPGIDAAIEKDIALGKTYVVSQTPTMVIHYRGQTFPISGVVTYDALHTFLDQLLSSR